MFVRFVFILLLFKPLFIKLNLYTSDSSFSVSTMLAIGSAWSSFVVLLISSFCYSIISFSLFSLLVVICRES